MFRRRLSEEPELPAVTKRSGRTTRLPSPPASSQVHQNSSSPLRAQDYHAPKTRRSSKQQLAKRPKREPGGETNNIDDSDLELDLKIDDSTIPRRSPRRRGADGPLQSVPNEPSDASQHLSPNNTGGRTLSDSDAVQLLEILHQSRDDLLTSSVSGKHPDKAFWASCLEKVNEKLGRWVFANWSDLKSWVKAHSSRQRERGIMQAPQAADSSPKQMLIYEWLWYWTYWELMVNAAKFHDSVVEIFSRGKLMQMLRRKYNVAEGEDNLMPFILNDVAWKALEARKKRLERPFRRTRRYSRFLGESEEDVADEDDEGDSSEEWTPSMDDPNPLTSVETDQAHEDGGERQGNNDDGVHDGAEGNSMTGTQLTPNTLHRTLEYMEVKFRQKQLLGLKNHGELSQSSNLVPVRLDIPEAPREHSEDRLHPKPEDMPDVCMEDGADDIGGHEDWQDQNANSEAQNEQQGDINGGPVENEASASTPSPGALSMSQRGSAAMSNSPLSELLASEILPPRPFSEILGSSVPHKLSNNRRATPSPDPFDESDDPFDESHDFASKNLLSSLKLQHSPSLVRNQANSKKDIPTYRKQGTTLNSLNRAGTPAALRRENEDHARKQFTRVRSSFAPVNQLKALLVPHTIHDTTIAHKEPRAKSPEPTPNEISTRMFYGSPAARWPVTKSHFQFMGTHIRFADDSEQEHSLKTKRLAETGQQYSVKDKDSSLSDSNPCPTRPQSSDTTHESGKQGKAVKRFNGTALSAKTHPQVDCDDDDDEILPPLSALFRKRPRAPSKTTIGQSVPQNPSPKKNHDSKDKQNDKSGTTNQVDGGKSAPNEPASALGEKSQLKKTPKESKQPVSSSMNTSDEGRATDGSSGLENHRVADINSEVALGTEDDGPVEGAASQPAQETPKEKKYKKSKGTKRKRSQSRAREAVNKQAPEASRPVQDATGIEDVEEAGDTPPSKRQQTESRPVNEPGPSSVPPKPFGQWSKKHGKKIFQEVTPSPPKPGRHSTASEKTKSFSQSHFGASPGVSCPNSTSRNSRWSRSVPSGSRLREEPAASPFANKRMDLPSSSMDTFLEESISLSSQHVIEHQSSYHKHSAQENLYRPALQSSPNMMEHPNSRRPQPCTPQSRTSSSTRSRPTSGLFLRSNSNMDNRYRGTPYNGSPSNKNARGNNRLHNNRGQSYTQQSRYQRSMTVDTNTALLNATPGSRQLGETIVQMQERLRDIRRHGETLVLMEAELQDMKRQFRRMNSNR